jgi:RHS repeat-associated protein
MEKDDEHTQGRYDFGARVYDSRLGKFLSLDPVVKAQESPYVSFSNNPVWFVDPNGMDTLVVHRKFLYKKHGVNVYKVTFSLIKMGVEKSVGDVMYMGTNAKYLQLPKKSSIKLEPDLPMSDHDGDGIGLYPGFTIHVDYQYEYGTSGKYGNGIFIHQQNDATGNAGCIAISSEEPVETADGRLLFGNSRDAVGKVLKMYEQANGGEDGGLLTGDEFLIKTDSEAPKKEPQVFGPLPTPLPAASNASKSVPEVIQGGLIK